MAVYVLAIALKSAYHNVSKLSIQGGAVSSGSRTHS
jgi:hypothetical protein